MLGPCIFFHWDGSCSTYQRFFSHLRTKLDTDINTEVGFCDLVVRSDEEKAILKAINQSFPSAQQLLCQCHLEENVRRHLQKK
jgi:transposase-like protein